jgi:hypothetical protein
MLCAALEFNGQLGKPGNIWEGFHGACSVSTLQLPCLCLALEILILLVTDLKLCCSWPIGMWSYIGCAYWTATGLLQIISHGE